MPQSGIEVLPCESFHACATRQRCFCTRQTKCQSWSQHPPRHPRRLKVFKWHSLTMVEWSGMSIVSLKLIPLLQEAKIFTRSSMTLLHHCAMQIHSHMEAHSFSLPRYLEDIIFPSLPIGPDCDFQYLTKILIDSGPLGPS